MLRAIETVYNGYRFRSRLEARWAVFFDALGIAYEYEPQGYEVGIEPRRRYLPDFFLSKLGCWVEVKGTVDALDFQLLADATDWGEGLPGMSDSLGTTRGLLLLGPIPLARSNDLPVHPLLQHCKGGWVSLAQFEPHRIVIPEEGAVYFDSTWGGKAGDHYWHAWVRRFFPGDEGSETPTNMLTLQVEHAYLAARQARFEYGQTPRAHRAVNTPPVAPVSQRYSCGYKPDDTVKHSKFGEGTIVSIHTLKDDADVTIRFADGVTRTLSAELARLVVVR